MDFTFQSDIKTSVHKIIKSGLNDNLSMPYLGVHDSTFLTLIFGRDFEMNIKLHLPGSICLQAPDKHPPHEPKVVTKIKSN